MYCIFSIEKKLDGSTCIVLGNSGYRISTYKTLKKNIEFAKYLKEKNMLQGDEFYLIEKHLFFDYKISGLDLIKMSTKLF